MNSVELKELIKQVRPSVAQVMAGGGSGTGLFVNSAAGLVLTALHVVLDEKAEEIATSVSVHLPVPESENARATFFSAKARAVAVDQDNDLVLLQMDANPFQANFGPTIRIRSDNLTLKAEPKVATLTLERPEEGEQVAVIGFPLHNRSLITTSGHISTPWATERFESTDRQVPDKRMDRYVADVKVNPGNDTVPTPKMGRLIQGRALEGRDLEPQRLGVSNAVHDSTCGSWPRRIRRPETL